MNLRGVIPNKTYLALGDSYTIGESVAAADRFPSQAVKKLNEAGLRVADAEIVATTGWTTGDLIHALEKKSLATHYDAVTLLIGVNNQYQGRIATEYEKEFEWLLQRAIQLAGGKPDHVIVLSIPDYSITPFAADSDQEKIAEEIDLFNTLNHSLASKYKVSWVDITAESRKAKNDPSLIAEDGLHFSGKGYARWVEKLFPVMRHTLE